MLHILTALKESDIQGIGLFTLQDISIGDVVWSEHADTTKKFTSKEDMLLVYPDSEKYAYLLEGVWHLNIDDGKYMNHSDTANTEYLRDKRICVATSFIPAGSEITSNYAEFDDEHDLYKESYI